MAQKNRAQMLTDITTNIFNNVINFITGQNAQDRFVNLLDSSPNIISDKDQPNGYVGLDAVGSMFSSYYNENISRADLVTLLTTNTAVGYKLYQVNDAVGATKILLVIADSNVTLYPFAIDLNTGEIGVYNINTDVFSPIVSGSQTLAQTLTIGNTSGANDIEFDTLQGLLFANAARLREGTIDAGLGGNNGIAQICAVGYELKWEAGRLYVMDGNGIGIRQSLYNFTTTPTVTDDTTKGYAVGSLWTLDDGTTYECTDATTGAAVWVVRNIIAGVNISVTGTPTAPIISSLADRYKTSSTTSNSISNGSKTFTVDDNLAYIPLQEVLIVFNSSNHMHARVTSYSGTTLVVDVIQHTGSGTYATWVINLDGTPVDAITGSGAVNRLAYFTAAQVIDDVAAITAARALKSDANGLPVHFDTTTEPSLTELSYVKGVTSAIQTQLNNAGILSIECIAGTITSPVDLAIYYWCIGGTFLTASTSATGQGSKFAYVFEITGITIRMTTTTSGSAEDSTLYLRNITAATSTLMGTFKTNGNIAYTSITGLAISCNTTDEYCLEMRSPTWATNPANLRLTASLFLRRT